MKPGPAELKPEEPNGNNTRKPPEKIELLVDRASGGLRLDQYLAQNIADLSRTRLKNLIEKGNVEVSGNRHPKPGKRLSEGEKVTIIIPPAEPLNLVPEQIPLDIVYEDAHVAVINKPPDMVVHPGAGNPSGTLVHALLASCKDLSGIGGKLRPGIVHRLDKDTSGLMIVAKTDRAHQLLVDMFKKRQIRKRYLAIAKGRFHDASVVVDLPIGRHPYKRANMCVDHRHGRPAMTTFRLIDAVGPHQLLEALLHTGRTHQIRVHLSHIGHPILGDKKYGGPVLIKAPDGGQLAITRQMLHSTLIQFNHPVTGQSICLEAPVPEDMANVLRFLRKYYKDQ